MLTSPTVPSPSKTYPKQKIITFIGDEKSGCSTLVGRFLDPPERQIQRYMHDLGSTSRLDAYKRCAVHVNSPEKERRVKISHKSNCPKGPLDHHQGNELMTLIDVSSDKPTINCLMKAIWLSNICVLVVDITPGKFESDFNNPNGNIKTQLQMAAAVGLKNLVVCLSKCDLLPNSDLIPRLEEIRSMLSAVLVWKNVPFIPVSCENAENIFSPSYEEFSMGITLKSALGAIQIENRKDWIEKPLMMVIYEFYKIGGVGTVIAGKIITGKLEEGQQVFFQDETSNLMKSIEIAYEPRTMAVSGEFCGINVRGVSQYDIRSHFIVYDYEYRQKKRHVDTFRALIKIVNQPKNGIKIGYTFKLYYAVTNNCLCKIEDIFHSVDPKTNQKKVLRPTILKKGNLAEVRMRPLVTAIGKSCFLHTFEENTELGRIVLMNGKQMIGAGKVLRIN